jgi:HAE1 family hydrophobic/amphiphilic exporter-1
MERMVFAAVPEAISSVVSITPSGTFGSAKAVSEIRLSLGPARDRDRSNTQIADDLRERLAGKIPGMTIRTRAPQGQFLLERILSAEEGVTVEVRGFALDTLDLLARQVADHIQDVPGITDVELSREAGIPQQEIQVDRAKVADLGLSVRDVTEAIQIAVAGAKASEYRVEGHSYRILVHLQDAERRSLEEILDLTLRTPGQGLVALRNLVTTKTGGGPVTIQRKDQQRMISVVGNVAGRDLGSVAADIQTRLERIPALWATT